MKIAHLISSQIFAGIEQHVFELSSFMSDVSDQVIICDESIRHYMVGMQTKSLSIALALFMIGGESLSRVMIDIESRIKKNKENFCFAPFFKSA